MANGLISGCWTGKRTTEPKCRLPQIEAGQYPGIERGLDDARQPPGGNAKICALLVPREMKVEHSNAIKDLTDEQLEAMIEYLEASLEAQAQSAKVIEGEAEVVPSLPVPAAPKAAS